MAKQTNVNLLPGNGAVAIFELQEFLRDQLGFTITISGDGIAAFDNTGTSVVTAGTSGANGMDNNNSYWVAQDPNGEYEWCCQHNGNANNWEIVYSAFDGFTGGNATTRPTATDEAVMWDGIFFPSNFNRWHLIGFDTSVGSPVGVFPWFAVGTDTNGDPEMVIAHDALAPGSYPSLTGTRAAPSTGDADPSIQWVYYDGNATGGSTSPFRWDNSFSGWQSRTDPAGRGWYKMNYTDEEQYVFLMGGVYHFSDAFADVGAPGDTTLNDGLGVNPYDGSDEIVPVPVGRSSAVGQRPFFKGFCENIYWRVVGGRAYPDTCDISGERFLYTSQIVIPFENGTTPL